MKVSGFSFIRNGEQLGYPYLASIKCLLEICDEVVIAVGLGDDLTEQNLRALANPHLRIINTTWNEKIQDRGYVYAQQKMIAQFNCTGDWAFYLEADEIIHEQDIPLIRAKMKHYLNDDQVEALVFDYYHFYGAPSYVAQSPRWYQRAPRIIKNTIRTWAPDGLFWLIMQNNKRGRYPSAALVGCYIYHYGHVRLIDKMQTKIKQVAKYWGHNSEMIKSYANIDPSTIIPFHGTHPQIIQSWLNFAAESVFTPNPKYKLSLREKKHRCLNYIAKFLGGIDWSKKHFKLVHD